MCRSEPGTTLLGSDGSRGDGAGIGFATTTLDETTGRAATGAFAAATGACVTTLTFAIASSAALSASSVPPPVMRSRSVEGIGGIGCCGTDAVLDARGGSEKVSVTESISSRNFLHLHDFGL